MELELGEHFDEGDFHRVVEGAERIAGARSAGKGPCWRCGLRIIQFRFQFLRQPQRHVGVLAGIILHLEGPHLVHRQLFSPPADQVLDADVLVLQFAAGEFVEVVRALAGVEKIMRDHGIAGHVRQVDTLRP